MTAPLLERPGRSSRWQAWAWGGPGTPGRAERRDYFTISFPPTAWCKRTRMRDRRGRERGPGRGAPREGLSLRQRSPASAPQAPPPPPRLRSLLPRTPALRCSASPATPRELRSPLPPPALLGTAPRPASAPPLVPALTSKDGETQAETEDYHVSV